MKRTKQSYNQQTETLLIEAFKSSGYLIVNKTLIKQLGLIPAILLSNYIDKHIYFREHNPEFDGWFFLTHKQQAEQLGLSDHQIRQGKKELFKKEFIQTEMKGIPAKEWYMINFDNLYKGLALEFLKVKPFKFSRAYIKENKLKENKNNNIVRPKNPSIKERNETYLPLAKHLFNIIRTKKNIKGTPLQVDTWADEIRKLIENNEVSYKRVEQALRWYKHNIGGQYIPVIESGQALRNKFGNLEAAMEREKRFTPDKPDHKIEHGQRWDLQEDGEYRNEAGRLLMED